MNRRQLSWLASFVLGAFASAMAAGPVPLASLQPSEAFSYQAGQQADVGQTTVQIPGHPVPEPALTFRSESRVVYAIPSGQSWFSGILFYPSQPRQNEGEPPYNVPILVHILVDEKPVWEQVMDGTTPPAEFFIPVRGGSRLTVLSKTPFVGPSFNLVNANFEQSGTQPASYYVIPPGDAYVDVAPMPRQALGIYRPDESVSVRAYYGGSANQAEVRLRLTPESGSQAEVEADLPVSLKTLDSGLAGGTATWKVPSSLGPARLEVTETVSGKVVFQRQARVAVVRPVELEGIEDNAFGAQISTAGFPMMYDDFANLWGAKWVRTYTRWSIVEAVQGQYDFSRIDEVVNNYRSQGLRVMLCLGEDAPHWVGYPGTPQYNAAWKQFVSAAVHHLAGRVNTWDVFNEVDAKYITFQGKGEADWDLAVLRTAIDTIHASDPQARVICCSTGSGQWLHYDQRLLAASMFSGVDIVSLHPYQATAPETKDGALNVRERLSALQNLINSHGVNKPIWATEANWMLGRKAGTNVNAPGLAEEAQAEYVVRASLLAVGWGTKYFVHSPFYTSRHPLPQLSTLAAYAQMASLFSKITQPTIMLSGPQVYGVTATTSSGRVGALWSAGSEAVIRLDDGGNYRFMDMYGNPVTVDPRSLRLSQAPLYFVASGLAPRAQVLSQANQEWKALPSVEAWQCHTGTNCTPVSRGRRIESPPSKYGLQLISPVVPVPSDSCQTLRLQVVMEKGGVNIGILDRSRKLVDNKKVLIQDVPSDQPQTVEVRFNTGPTDAVQIMLANGNQTETQSIFTILDRPEIGGCL